MALDGVLKVWPWSSKAGRAGAGRAASGRKKTDSGRKETGSGRKKTVATRARSRAKAGIGWWRGLKSAGFCLVGLIALCILSLGLVVAYQALLVSPFFALDRLSINGRERLDQEEILRLAGVQPGMNLLKVNPKVLIQRLESSPWVEQAQIRRVLPDEMRIHILEKKPWALLHSEGLWYLDRIGRPIKRIEAGEEFNLPIITGLSQEAAETAQGRQDLAEAMEIVARLSRAGSPLLLDQVSEIRFSLGSGATILPLSSGPRIILGRGGMELKMEHWKKVLADLEDKGIGTRVDYIDLRLGDKAFVGLKAG